jgi:thioesterase domain-containing protein
MFDCIAPGSTRAQPRRRRRPLKSVAVRLRRAGRRLVERPPASDGLGGRIRRAQLASRSAKKRHRPGPTTTPAVLFTSAAHRARSGEPILGWQPFLRGPLEVHDYGGRHTELIREAAPSTAPLLDQALSRHDPS